MNTGCVYEEHDNPVDTFLDVIQEPARLAERRPGGEGLSLIP